MCQEQTTPGGDDVTGGKDVKGGDDVTCFVTYIHMQKHTHTQTTHTHTHIHTHLSECLGEALSHTVVFMSDALYTYRI